MDPTPLYDRLGSRDGVTKVVHRVIANHFEHPTLKTRFDNAKLARDQLTDNAVEFFCTGLSGVPTYEGQSLPDAHRGMNISEEEFVAVIDDVLAALVSEGVGPQEQAEVLAMLWGMKAEVVRL